MMDLKKKSLLSGIAVLFLGAFLAVVPPTASNAQDVLQACADDVRKYCSQVTLGDGRLLACMYAHEDKISNGCDAAIGEAADQLDWFLSGIREAVEKCAGDINKHCSGVEAGQGRIYACLKLKKSELASECKGVVETVSQRLTAE